MFLLMFCLVGHIPAGRVSGVELMSADWLPTVARLSGSPLLPAPGGSQLMGSDRCCQPLMTAPTCPSTRLQGGQRPAASSSAQQRQAASSSGSPARPHANTSSHSGMPYRCCHALLLRFARVAGQELNNNAPVPRCVCLCMPHPTLASGRALSCRPSGQCRLVLRP